MLQPGKSNAQENTARSSIQRKKKGKSQGGLFWRERRRAAIEMLYIQYYIKVIFLSKELDFKRNALFQASSQNAPKMFM